MSWRAIIHPDLASACRQLWKRDRVRYEQLRKKIHALTIDPESGKPLHPPLKGLWRVHIGQFVLLYEIHDNEQTVTFLRLTHHDKAYHR